MPLAPAVSQASTVVRITLDVPADVLTDYQKQADEQLATLTNLLTARLTACRAHQAIRPLYLDDASREEVEQLLGGGIFAKPADLIRALRTQYTVSIGGANIKIDPQVYTLLKDRAEETHRSLRDLIVETCLNALADATLGGH